MSENYEITYGEVLYELRTYYGYKQKEIGDYLNITSQAYSNYENNKRMPDVETMYKIARFYGISLDTLISYRFTEQRNYKIDHTNIFRGISDSGITIPLTAKEAKMVTDILSLSKEQLDACKNYLDFIKKPIY